MSVGQYKLFIEELSLNEYSLSEETFFLSGQNILFPHFQ